MELTSVMYINSYTICNTRSTVKGCSYPHEYVHYKHSHLQRPAHLLQLLPSKETLPNITASLCQIQGPH